MMFGMIAGCVEENEGFQYDSLDLLNILQEGLEAWGEG
jgi:hypothetical protein